MIVLLHLGLWIHLWFYLRDCFLFLNILFVILYLVLLNWYFVFHEESWVIVNVLKTSDKILPEWFFLFLFGFLKSVPDKFMGLFILVLLLFSFFLFILNSILWFSYCRLSFLWYGLSFVLLVYSGVFFLDDFFYEISCGNLLFYF